MTDLDLLARIRFGDRTAFSELVGRHNLTLYRTALAIVRSPADAEDVAQESWLQAFRHLEEFRGTATVKTWLIAITRNHALSYHRAARRRLARDADFGRIVPAEGRSPEEEVLQNERRDQLAQHIARLPRRLRIPLGLWHSGNYSYPQIARVAGVTTGTIKSRIWEARQIVLAAAGSHHGHVTSHRGPLTA
jgi:RNA polymerase sigma-70 factor, ECF subfamily